MGIFLTLPGNPDIYMAPALNLIQVQKWNFAEGRATDPELDLRIHLVQVQKWSFAEGRATDPELDLVSLPTQG